MSTFNVAIRALQGFNALGIEQASAIMKDALTAAAGAIRNVNGSSSGFSLTTTDPVERRNVPYDLGTDNGGTSPLVVSSQWTVPDEFDDVVRGARGYIIPQLVGRRGAGTDLASPSQTAILIAPVLDTGALGAGGATDVVQAVQRIAALRRQVTDLTTERDQLRAQLASANANASRAQSDLQAYRAAHPETTNGRSGTSQGISNTTTTQGSGEGMLANVSPLALLAVVGVAAVALGKRRG